MVILLSLLALQGWAGEPLRVTLERDVEGRREQTVVSLEDREIWVFTNVAKWQDSRGWLGKARLKGASPQVSSVLRKEIEVGHRFIQRRKKLPQSKLPLAVSPHHVRVMIQGEELRGRPELASRIVRHAQGLLDGSEAVLVDGVQLRWKQGVVAQHWKAGKAKESLAPQEFKCAGGDSPLCQSARWGVIR